MMTFEEKMKIIDDAVYILSTGKNIVSENGTLQKSFKVINKAIKLDSIEVDMGLLMLSKIFQTSNTHLDSGRVVQLLRNNEIGTHLIYLMDNYLWSFNGLMKVKDFQSTALINKKIYNIDNRAICTGFTTDGEINSFVLKEYIE